MEPLTEEQEQQRRFAAVLRLLPLGFRPIGGMMFMKGDTAYDLSAADLDQIDRIEREGLFVIPPDEVKGRIVARGEAWKAAHPGR